MKVLIIEDDLVLGESLKEYLQKKGIDVVWIFDDREVFNVLPYQEFDVIVLDLILRFSTGENILKSLRDKNIDIPVLVLTAKNSIHDKETCFTLGADDYLTKPFSTKELLLRLKALAKRKRVPEKININNNVVIDLDRGMIIKDDQEIKLSKKAWEVLYVLAKNKGDIVPSEKLMRYVWQDKPVGDEVLRTYIKELRKLLPQGSIETYKGRGYRLV
ncbi:MAG: response regulator transcription factor [Aquificae bacterium]|nr:response regulator transcription factor [Aquificota bacterium]